MSVPTALRLRPLEIGDVLDEIFRMYRRHFLLIGGVAIATAIPFAAVAAFGFFAVFGDVLNQASSGTPIDPNQLGNLFLGVGVGYAIYFLLQPLQYGAIMFAVCESAQGRPVTLRGMLRGALRNYVRLLGFGFLLLLMALFFCLFPLWIWILVGWVGVLPVLFIEKVGLGAAMGRSWRLVQGMWWRTFFILFLVGIVGYVINIALDAFFYLAQTLISAFVSPFLALSVYEGANIVVNALVTPILLIAIVLVYFDLRVRKEGIDLFQLAGRLAAAPPALA